MEQNLRNNYEATDDALSTLRGLVVAFDILENDYPAPMPTSNEALAKSVLLRRIVKSMDELDHLRAQEWAGLGGKTGRLTPDEIAKAQGNPEIIHHQM